jgi:hypothetical protein
MYVDVCVCLLIFLLFICMKRKCVLKIIHKVVSHHMYVINILVCGTYDNFQNKNHLDMGFVWIFVWIFIIFCGLNVFFCASVNVSVYVVSCGCFVCLFRVDIMFVCFFFNNST